MITTHLMKLVRAEVCSCGGLTVAEIAASLGVPLFDAAGALGRLAFQGRVYGVRTRVGDSKERLTWFLTNDARAEMRARLA